MNLREQDYTLEIRENIILPFEEQTLASGLCDVTLPMKFVKSKEKKKIIYECEGYVSVSELNLSKLRDVFEIIEKTLITLNKSKEFLIDPSRFKLNHDTVYYNLKYKDVKIAYVPDEKETLDKKIDRFLASFEINGELGNYMERLKEYIKYSNPSVEGLINYVGEVRREIYMCGIK